MSAIAAPDAAFLIHGLGGTQYDLGSMHKRLKNAGLVTYSLTLPGHGTKPEDLARVAMEDDAPTLGRRRSEEFQVASLPEEAAGGRPSTEYILAGFAR